MKREPISPTKFQRSFATSKARTKTAVEACIGLPSPEAIHEARIATRKLTTIVSLMPKRFRRDDRTVKAMDAFRLFYTDCAKIRDIDVLTSALSKDVANEKVKNIVEGLKAKRSVLLEGVFKSGVETSRLALPGFTHNTRRRLGKRLNKLLDRRARRAVELYHIAVGGDEKSVELHKFRKECRHILYLLNFAKENSGVKSVKTELEDAKEKLGSIRDDDLLLNLFKNMHETVPIAKIVAAVSADRLAKYNNFFSVRGIRGRNPRLIEAVMRLTGAPTNSRTH